MMTHDEIIAVVAAHRDGKAIEWRSPYTANEWVTSIAPGWNFATVDYRIKPEPPKPRECWISLRVGQNTSPAHLNRASAASHMLTSEVIHVREVLPEFSQ